MSLHLCRTLFRSTVDLFRHFLTQVSIYLFRHCMLDFSISISLFHVDVSVNVLDHSMPNICVSLLDHLMFDISVSLFRHSMHGISVSVLDHSMLDDGVCFIIPCPTSASVCRISPYLTSVSVCWNILCLTSVSVCWNIPCLTSISVCWNIPCLTSASVCRISPCLTSVPCRFSLILSLSLFHHTSVSCVSSQQCKCVSQLWCQCVSPHQWISSRRVPLRCRCRGAVVSLGQGRHHATDRSTITGHDLVSNRLILLTSASNPTPPSSNPTPFRHGNLGSLVAKVRFKEGDRRTEHSGGRR